MQWIEYWRPLIDLASGAGGLLMSAVAVAISIAAWNATRSDADVQLSLGNDFALTILRGNHLRSWDFPEIDTAADRECLVLAFALIFANSGARQGVIDYMHLDIENLETGQSLQLDWKIFFATPRAREAPSGVELVTPVVISGNGSEKRLAMFLSHSGSKVERFFANSGRYRLTFNMHTAGDPNPPSKNLTTVYQTEWVCSESNGCLSDIRRRTFGPDENPPFGEGALLQLAK